MKSHDDLSGTVINFVFFYVLDFSSFPNLHGTEKFPKPTWLKTMLCTKQLLVAGISNQLQTCVYLCIYAACTYVN